ncbi:MAG: TIGR02710 family CRISPR-associated CARF protein [Candidatus Bathyarchaeales archaeon]
MKALIISVGTGTKQNIPAMKSLAGAIAHSINHHNPDKVFFVTSSQSRENTLPTILEKTKLPQQKYEIIELNDPDNIQNIYETVNPHFKRIKTQYDNIVVDYTSGTKAMTAALAILATLHEAQELSYITGKRIGGIVQAGTERIMAIQPYFATTEQKIKQAIQFFNKSQYATAISILTQIKKTTHDPTITERIKPLLQLAKAYDQWDKFQHQKAFEILKKIKEAELNGNKRFLGQMLNSENPEPYLIADLINNAQRRAQEEQKYDDAVARLYRTTELIAQYKLKRYYNIDPSNTDTQKIPQQLLSKWNLPPETKTIKLSLEKDYQLLEALGDIIGKTYAQDNKLKNLLSKRNTSILAHGLKPVSKDEYNQLHKIITKYAEETIQNLKQLLEDSKHIKWKNHQNS